MRNEISVYNTKMRIIKENSYKFPSVVLSVNATLAVSMLTIVVPTEVSQYIRCIFSSSFYFLTGIVIVRVK